MKKQLLYRFFLLISLSGAFATTIDFIHIKNVFAPQGTVTGVVFRDFNANGVKDNTATFNEPFEAGITVTAYDDAGNVVASTVSTGTGPNNYTLTGAAVTGKLRIEFTGYGATGSSPTHKGTTNATNVQFVDATASGTANFAINDPSQFNNTNPLVAVVRNFIGNTSTTGNTIEGILYNDAQSTTPTKVTLATNAQTGTGFGLAFSRKTKTLFTSAVVRNYMNTGPGGFDAIYSYKFTSPSTSTQTATLDLSVLGANMGADPRTGPLTGGAPFWVDNNNVYQNVGRAGIGGITTSAEGDTLYAVNMNATAPSLVVINVANPAAASLIKEVAIPTPGCTNGVFRPWGVEYYHGKVYVGGVCDASTGGTAANLTAYVYSYDGTNFTQVTSLPLNYQRGKSTFRAANNAYQSANWLPWSNTWPTPTPFALALAEGDILSAPQPMLSDINFETDGSMVLTFADRFAYQAAYRQRQYGLTTGSVQYSPVSAGDVIKLCNISGTLTPEATTGSCVQTNTDNGSVTTANPINAPNGIKEYFDDDYYNTGTSGTGQAGHSETSLGAGLVYAGTNQTLTTNFDPISTTAPGGTSGPINTSGIRRYTDATGSNAANGWVVVADPGVVSPAATNRKGGSLGDMELLSDGQPIEIGNRIWIDTDKDGIQDPSETNTVPDGTVVTLRSPGDDGIYGNADDQTWTTTTAADGTYYFNEINVTNDNRNSGTDPGSTLNLGWTGVVGILPNQPYRIEVNTPTNYKVTTNDVNTNVDEIRDSDATLLSGVIVSVPVNTAVTNHNYDIGFIQTVSIGSTVFIDSNNDGTQSGATELGIPNATVNLYFDADGNGTIDGAETTALKTTTTDASGNYIFIDLPEGKYQVGVVPVTAYPQSSTPTVTGDTQADDGKDHGTQTALAAEAKSGIITLAVGTEPTTAETAQGNNGTTTTPEPLDTSGDMTIDFGFFNPVSIGSTVFIDSNNDGTQSGTTELGIPNATVNLYYDANNNGSIDGAELTPFKTTTTDNNGDYIFIDLVAGNYQVGVVPVTAYPQSSTTTVTGDTQADDGKDHGTQSAPAAEAKSGIIMLTAGTEPTTAETAQGNNGSTTTTEPVDANGDMTIDFGFFNPVSIGSTVFIDSNNDGTQSGVTELGIPNATVNLYYDANNNGSIDGAELTPFKTTTTDNNGDYIFIDLVAGNYQVGVVPVTAYPQSSTPTVTGDTQADDGKDHGTQSAPAAEAKSGIIMLTAGTEPTTAETAQGNNGTTTTTEPVDANGDMTIDFGFFNPVSMGSTVFIDKNNDGNQSGTGETGISGVTVKLYYDLNNNGVIDGGETTECYTTITDADGNYIFTNLAEGNWVVGVVPPTAYPTSSTPTITGDTDNDDGKDHGTQPASGAEAKSGIIALRVGSEPTTSETAQGSNGTTLVPEPVDANGNMTVDFGFFDPNALPVTLIDFNGNQLENQINLTWKIANEKGFSHFEVQKSGDATEFRTIAIVNGNKVSIYNAIDINPNEGINYYRLKMVDLDGSSKLSKVISLNFEKGGSYLTIENPAQKGEFKVITNFKNPRFMLLNSIGEIVNFITTEIGNAYLIKANNIVAGVYYLRIESNGKFQTRKIIIN